MLVSHQLVQRGRVSTRSSVHFSTVQPQRTCGTNQLRNQHSVLSVRMPLFADLRAQWALSVESHSRLWRPGGTIPGSLTLGQSTTLLAPCVHTSDLLVRVPAFRVIDAGFGRRMTVAPCQLVRRAHTLFCLRGSLPAVSWCEWPWFVVCS